MLLARYRTTLAEVLGGRVPQARGLIEGLVKGQMQGLRQGQGRAQVQGRGRREGGGFPHSRPLGGGGSGSGLTRLSVAEHASAHTAVQAATAATAAAAAAAAAAGTAVQKKALHIPTHTYTRSSQSSPGRTDAGPSAIIDAPAPAAAPASAPAAAALNVQRVRAELAQLDLEIHGLKSRLQQVADQRRSQLTTSIPA